MGTFYRRFRRIFFGLIFANAVFGLLQFYYVCINMVNHNWLWMSVSVFCFAINIGCGYSMYKSWRHTQQEEKDYMWRVLSAKDVDHWAV